MAFLAHSEIKTKIDQGFLLRPEDFNSDSLHQASYDLSLGQELYIVGETVPRILTEEEPYVALQPGQFAVLTSHEYIKLPKNLIAFISVRSTFKFDGLVNISGFHIDPTFEGQVRFAVQNVGPADIRLKLKHPTFTIFFAELTSDQIGKSRDEQSEIEFSQGSKGIRLEDIQALGGTSVTLSSLQKEVEKLRMMVFVYGPLVVAAALALIVNLLRRP